MVTDKFFAIYSLDKMLPLQGEIVNKTNKEHGYISIKTKNALNTKTDNKEWICIPTKWLTGGINLNDVINSINKAREVVPKIG
jgi:hypothetical protein